jgi:hypothetical protein
MQPLSVLFWDYKCLGGSGLLRYKSQNKCLSENTQESMAADKEGHVLVKRETEEDLGSERWGRREQ